MALKGNAARLDYGKVCLILAERGEGLKDLAEMLGISRQGVNNLFHANNRPQTIGKVAKALEVSAKDIVTD